MDRAWANGIHWFDTADAYGGGRSETFIGRWRAANRPEGLVLTTKVFHSTVGNPDDTGLAPDRIRRQLEAACRGSVSTASISISRTSPTRARLCPRRSRASSASSKRV